MLTEWHGYPRCTQLMVINITSYCSCLSEEAGAWFENQANPSVGESKELQITAMLFWAWDTRIHHASQIIGPVGVSWVHVSPCLVNCYRMWVFPHVSHFLILYHTKFHPNICFHLEVSKTFQKNKPSEKLGTESRALPFLCSGPTGPGKQKDPVQRQQDYCFCVCICTLEVLGQAGCGSVGHIHVKLPCERSLCRMYLVLQKFLSVWENYGNYPGSGGRKAAFYCCGSLPQAVVLILLLWGIAAIHHIMASLRLEKTQAHVSFFFSFNSELLFSTQCCSFGHFF